MKVTEESFLKDVAKHQLTVVHADGLHRHLRFAEPGTSCQHYDIVTWPGYLAFTGDIGSFVFWRTDDMLTFFRGKPDGPLRINPSYWSEKLEAVDNRCSHPGAKEFSQDRFERAVITHLVTWLKQHRHDTTKDQRRELWESVQSEVLRVDGDVNGYREQIAAYDFHHRVSRSLDFYFQDFSEVSVHEYTARFIWCCYAIVWGIRLFDAAKVTA